MPRALSNIKTIFEFLDIFMNSTREMHLACNGFVSGSETELGSVVVELATSTTFYFSLQVLSCGVLFYLETQAMDLNKRIK